ncbi:PREDICTED: A disintegrin and metalloproteinase with thrombospondin motifs 9-like, partial [Branchiostoma belcheri]|uniref:A disintegrin and metalloproteinase with thrombospondin motifs 9-like n=1 Tax=Branchiostoma belcheri TaxID=7741 RepID=A0A6P5A8E6_BRABE
MAASGHKATSCSEVKSVNPAADDGEYTLHPFSADNDVSLRVYCHVIASENPKEFLTLPAGAEENYSIVSSDQLLGSTWFLCPGILQQPYVSRAGTTKFSKLRIKFENSSVEVIRVDYTFASTCGPNEISYAHAGDCYSEGQGCAKGTFKVNLTGTELKLAPGVHWALQERNPASLTINDMFISMDRKVASARC